MTAKKLSFGIRKRDVACPQGDPRALHRLLLGATVPQPIIIGVKSKDVASRAILLRLSRLPPNVGMVGLGFLRFTNAARTLLLPRFLPPILPLDLEMVDTGWAVKVVEVVQAMEVALDKVEIILVTTKEATTVILGTKATVETGTEAEKAAAVMALDTARDMYLKSA